MRASAVEFMEQLALGTAGTGAPTLRARRRSVRARPRPQRPARQPATLSAAQVNALIGAASDPEAIVRAQAVNGAPGRR